MLSLVLRHVVVVVVVSPSHPRRPPPPGLVQHVLYTTLFLVLYLASAASAVRPLPSARVPGPPAPSSVAPPSLRWDTLSAVRYRSIMASDAYYSHGPSDSHQPPYPSSFDPVYDPRSYQNPPLHHQSLHHSYPDPEPASPQSRSSSHPPSETLHQPLRDALSHAFDQSDAARTVDPDLIAQITAQVKQSVLDEIKLNGVGHTAPPPQPYAPPSPISSRPVYTPPSPKPYDAGPLSGSPEQIVTGLSSDGPSDASNVHHGSPSIANMPEKSSRRPPPPPRASTEGDFSPIERMWQRLFDENGMPTQRVGQFLRGLAVHLVGILPCLEASTC